ncbi:MAG: hypothetical protein AAFR21_10165 [Pseudomonadota bacterium]
MEISRRHLMIASGATGALVVGGGALVATGTSSRFLENLLRRSLPGITFSDTAISEYVSDYLAFIEDDTRSNIQLIMRITRLVGFGGLEVMFDRVDRLAIWRRMFITRFVASSDIAFEKFENVEYFGLTLDCGRNPWAEFD